MVEGIKNMLRGNALRYGDNISTDLLIAGRYMYLRSNLPELAKHACEDLDADFVKRVKPGDFVVGGRNFGLGSSREHAAIVLKMNGVGAVIASSFARIFFRNAINIGLPVVIADTKNISDGDEIEIDLAGGKLKNRSTGKKQEFSALPAVMLDILSEGGLIPYVKKHGDFVV
jgi:3-isopropylmalate/(R)-2-methylmalate dehydratase small subunit